MPNVVLLEISFSETKVDDVIETLAEAYGYQAVLMTENGPKDNPQTMENFVKLRIKDNILSDYVEQKKKKLKIATGSLGIEVQ